MKALAPEHREDLSKSGLTEATITFMQVAAMPPGDIKLRGVTSAYVLPYFHLDGTTNNFKRAKLFPPVKTDHGTMRYWQPPNTSPHLYVPPLLGWASVARNPTTELTICEGEKKAAAACQHGLIAASIGGVWCWRTTLDNGEKFTLPQLDEFQWPTRSVLICPDSDAWREDKGFQILSGMFALAKELQQRGASVQFVKLPDLPGSKTGLDDWLLVPSHDVEHSWPKLERIPLDDPRFDPLTAWWQRWREKQATQTSLKAHDQDELTLDEVVGLYTLRAPTHQVMLTFDRLQEQRGSVHAEVTVTLGATVLLDAVDLGLKSDSSQTNLVKSLKVYSTDVPWKMLLQKACALVLRRHREGAPLSILSKDTLVEPLMFSINPIVPRKKPVILFSDGGKGKSTLALMLAMLTATGQRVGPFSALKGSPLYLDWEDDVDVHARRLKAIQSGHPELLDALVFYQRCTEPLTRLTHDLARTVQARGITLVVIDSILQAAGGDASAEATGKLFAAIRSLGVESLCIGHVPKSLGEGQEHATVYGSVFNQNLARGLWELKTEQEIGEDSAILGLFHRKHNLTRKHAPIGLKVTHDQEGTFVQYEAFDLSKTVEIEKTLPLPSRIRNLLDSDGVPRSAQEIAESLSATLKVVQSTLSRYSKYKWSMLGDNRSAQWTTLRDLQQ
ncbi:MAG: AAA family ATPase [Nitrospirales bacterium]